MSVRVNLLPGDVRAKSQANRSRLVAAAGVGLVLVVLAGFTLLQRGQISDAQADLAAITARNAELQADIAALQPFADLETRAGASVDLTAVALGDESSLATVLQDLSAVFPPNAELESLSVLFLPEAEAPAAGGNRVIFGRMSATGRVLDGVAPGVERLIIDIDRVAAFDNALVTTSAVDEDGIATFALEVELGEEVLTDRYVRDDEGATP